MKWNYRGQNRTCQPYRRPLHPLFIAFPGVQALRARILHSTLKSSFSATPTCEPVYLEIILESSLTPPALPPPPPHSCLPATSLSPSDPASQWLARAIFLKNKPDHVTLLLTSLWPGGEVQAAFPVRLQPPLPGYPLVSGTYRSLHKHGIEPLLQPLLGPLKPRAEATPLRPCLSVRSSASSSPSTVFCSQVLFSISGLCPCQSLPLGLISFCLCLAGPQGACKSNCVF